MNILISDIVKRVFSTARPNIAILVAVTLEASINASAHSEAAEVKLTLVH